MVAPRPARPNPALVVAGLALIVAAVWLGRPVLRDYQALQQLKAAQPCMPSDPATDTECTRSVSGTIVAVSTSGRTTTIRVGQPSPAAGDYALPADAPAVAAAAVGDQVEVELWRGRAVALQHYGARSYTADAPYQHDQTRLIQALIAALAGLALLTKFALRTSLPMRRDRPLVLSDWRTTAYFTVWAGVISASTVLRFYADGENGISGNWAVDTAGVLVLLLGLAGVSTAIVRFTGRWSTTDEEPADVAAADGGVHDDPGSAEPAPIEWRRSRGTRVRWAGAGTAAVIVGGCLAGGAVTAAFVNRSEVATIRASVAALPCTSTTATRCLRQEDATVWGIDADAATPSIWIRGPVVPDQWVYFPAAQRNFVRSLQLGQLLSLEVWDRRIVSVTLVGTPTAVGTDESPFVPVNAALIAALLALAALILGIRLRWPHLRGRRLPSEVTAALLVGFAVWAGERGDEWWPYPLTVAFVVVCLTVPAGERGETLSTGPISGGGAR